MKLFLYLALNDSIYFSATQFAVNHAPGFTGSSVTYYLLIDYMSFHATLPQVSFSDQTPYFIGRNLQSVSYPVEMMKWLWSTMKVTFGRWTVFIFITAEFLYYFPLIKHETHPLLKFSVCDKCFSSSADIYIREFIVSLESIKQKVKMSGLWFPLMTRSCQVTR